MEDNESKTRQVAKWVLSSAIHVVVSRVVSNTADNYTRFNKDSMAVNIGSGAVGMVVAVNAKPITDKIVDMSADYIVVQRVKFQAKRNAKKQEK